MTKPSSPMSKSSPAGPDPSPTPLPKPPATSRTAPDWLKPSQDFSMLSDERFLEAWNAGLKALEVDRWFRRALAAGMSEEEAIAFLNSRQKR